MIFLQGGPKFEVTPLVGKLFLQGLHETSQVVHKAHLTKKLNLLSNKMSFCS